MLRLRHYAIRTEQCYGDWVRRYVKFHGMRSRDELLPGAGKVKRFLSELAVNGNVSASTQMTSGRMESINRKIKTLLRKVYGFRDDDFLRLKLYALHEAKHKLVG